ncbi:unnamed protein product, partial [Mesorhabditis belari]|uniref:Domain of unknown function DB domain-containing protein n=1 Tax=Mesorhabditis belari TaxID=2138241 RepID=A0AAF3J658_9BILA
MPKYLYFLFLQVIATFAEDDLLLVDGDSKYFRDQAILRNDPLALNDEPLPLHGVIVAPIKGRRIYTREQIPLIDYDKRDAALRAFYDRVTSGGNTAKIGVDPIFVTRAPPRTTLSTPTPRSSSISPINRSQIIQRKTLRLSSDSEVDRVHSTRLATNGHQIRALSAGKEKLVPFGGTSLIIPLSLPVITGKTVAKNATKPIIPFAKLDDEPVTKKTQIRRETSRIPLTPMIRFPLKAWQIPSLPAKPLPVIVENPSTKSGFYPAEWSNAKAPLVFQFAQADPIYKADTLRDRSLLSASHHSSIYPPRFSGESGGASRRSRFPMNHRTEPIPLPEKRKNFELALQESERDPPNYFSASIDETILSIDRDEAVHRMSDTEKLKHFVTKFPEAGRFSQQMDLTSRPSDITSFSRTAIGDIFRELSPLQSHLSLTANEKLGLCCRKQRLSARCSTLCDFDTFTDKSLITAVLTLQCPGPELGRAFDCASSKADHTSCCIRAGLATFLGGRCLPFCQTHLDTPPNIVDYLPCLQVFDTFKRCFRDYQTKNKNLFESQIDELKIKLNMANGQIDDLRKLNKDTTIQELQRKVATHSEPTDASDTIQYEDGNLVLIARDDGSSEISSQKWQKEMGKYLGELSSVPAFLSQVTISLMETLHEERTLSQPSYSVIHDD